MSISCRIVQEDEEDEEDKDNIQRIGVTELYNKNTNKGNRWGRQTRRNS